MVAVSLKKKKQKKIFFFFFFFFSFFFFFFFFQAEDGIRDRSPSRGLGDVYKRQLMDLAVESEYDIRRQGTLMVAKYAMGHGVLRPEAAVGIKEA